MNFTYHDAGPVRAGERVRHGFDIIDATELPSGTVYPILRRLERDSLVTRTGKITRSPAMSSARRAGTMSSRRPGARFLPKPAPVSAFRGRSPHARGGSVLRVLLMPASPSEPPSVWSVDCGPGARHHACAVDGRVAPPNRSPAIDRPLRHHDSDSLPDTAGASDSAWSRDMDLSAGHLARCPMPPGCAASSRSTPMRCVTPLTGSACS